MGAKRLPVIAVVCWLISSTVAVGQIRGPVDVVVLEQHETAEPVRDIPQLPQKAAQNMKPVYHVPHNLAPAQPDTALLPALCGSRSPLRGFSTESAERNRR